jgi:glycosyltransferase involved in cell wall biosynthesis
MMKIITAMYTIRRGGAYERFLMMLGAFLDRECDVHCISLTPIQIKHPFYHNHVLNFPFKIKEGLLPKLLVLLLFPIYSFLIGYRERIDLFVAFGPLYAFLQAIPKSIMMKPMVTLIRLELSFAPKARDLSKFFLWMNRIIEYGGLIFSDRIIAVNTAIQKDIMKFIKRRRRSEVKVLFNNIPQITIPADVDILEMRRRLGIPERAKVLVTAGILTPRKNIETLINCLPKMEGNNIYILIVGDSSTEPDFRYKNLLQGLAKKLKVDKRVIFKGWVEKEDLWKIYLASDLFILPSLSEGMPNAMLEALGVDLPCIGSNIAGINDILQYKELMFDPLNEKAIAEKIQHAFCDSQFFNKIKELCQERKKTFTFDWKEKVFQMVTKRTFPSRCL